MSGHQEVVYLEVEGRRRRYVIFRPDEIVASGRLTPLVIMLDGRGGTPWTAMKITQWNETAEREGFAVVYPEATRVDPVGPLHFLTNPQMWNAGPGGSDTERPDVDDLTFLRLVVDDVVNRARIDRTRIYMTGFSNGAAMTYRYALTFPDTLAAIAPVAGHLRTRDREIVEPIPMISFFGRLDPLSPYDGGAVDLPWGVREVRPAAVESVHFWAGLCGHAVEAGRWETETGFSRLVYGQSGARDEVVFITVDDLGHVWPGGHRLLPEPLVGPTSDRIRANDAIWQFFSRHQR
jgi:polyhydroxybutyrate depolymerase